MPETDPDSTTRQQPNASTTASTTSTATAAASKRIARAVASVTSSAMSAYDAIFPRRNSPPPPQNPMHQAETPGASISVPLQDGDHAEDAYLNVPAIPRPPSALSVTRTGKSSKDPLELRNELGPKIVIVMCGLPARGKSYICKKLCKYLSWCGYNTRVFNVGNRRRVNVPPTAGQPTSPTPASPTTTAAPRYSSTLQPLLDTFRNSLSFGGNSPILGRPGTLHDSSFFDPTNKEFKATREKLALETLDELIHWLQFEGGKVAIHDATNSTVDRRRAVMERVKQEKNLEVIFVESICTEGEVLEKNIIMKLQGPDYINMPREEAIRDFRARMTNYEKAYQTISEPEEEVGISYIKIINVGKKIHIKERTIWLTRHGESTYNRVNRIGGDPPLTQLGSRYAVAMNKFIQANSVSRAAGGVAVGGVDVWTSTLMRAVQSVEGFDDETWNVMHFKALGEIFAGICEDMTYEEIERTYPEVSSERSKNKLNYRYPGPGGESYMDVIERLRPIIVELERMESDIAIVTHQVVLRTLLAYFCNIPLPDMPTLNTPLHTLYKLSPKPYGADVEVYRWNPDTDEISLVGGSEMLLEKTGRH